jgi:phenylalanyl-tRNA synthetase alpha chain
MYQKTMNHRIDDIQLSFKKTLQKAVTIDDIEQLRIAFLGRNGAITLLMQSLKDLPLEEKKIYGSLLNNLKMECQAEIVRVEDELKKRAADAALLADTHFDVTASTVPDHAIGHLHVYSQLIEQLEDIFISMGYTIADGPEVETDYYNFEALNIPLNHPARDMQDTFWLDIPGMLLRTHTSPVQIHAMQKNKPPLAIFAPGRVYRNEATDGSHDFMFMQGECLFIDKHVSVAHLLATARSFLQAIFGNDTIKLRIRPGYFPFVEPGLEIDASCPFCTQGCSVCKHTGWIELLGSGLIHPHVLRAGNIDPDVYSGFAFGFGLERLAMIKYGINDIRLFRSSKLAFLNQF